MVNMVYMLVSVLLFIIRLNGHLHGAYSHDDDIGGGDKANWMADIYDGKKLSVLSLPGTHDTMSFYGGDMIQTQSLNLTKQLDAGVRVLDIRCAHIFDRFAIHHGISFQYKFFDDVMNELTGWLSLHSKETVLAIITLSEDVDLVEFTAVPTANSRSAEATFEEYYQTYENYIWSGFDTSSFAPIPTLGEVRGQIVILQNFGSIASTQKYGINSNDGNIVSRQDEYSVSTNWDLYDKWIYVRNKVDETRISKSNHKFHMNYLSGSGGSFPYFIVSGHSSSGSSAARLATGLTTPGWANSYPDFPRVDCTCLLCLCMWGCDVCTIAFEGTNVLLYNYISRSIFEGITDVENYDFVGIIMTDFPGKDLLDVIIGKNDQYKVRFMDEASFACPSEYTATGLDNCCTASETSACGETCRKNMCTVTGVSWYWDPYDYSSHDYTCCYKGDSCPSYYDSNDGECCYATLPLSSTQAQDSCNAASNWVWIPLDYSSNAYTCCHRRDIPFGSEVGGTINANKQDYYEVHISATTPTVYFESCGSDYDTYLYLYNANMNLLYSGDDNNARGRACGNRGDLYLENIAAGTYFLGVGGWQSSAGTYKVSMSNGAINCGETVTQEISAYSKDILRIDLQSDYEMVYWEACNSSFDTYLYLYDENGADGENIIVSCDDCNNHGNSCGSKGDLSNYDMVAGIYYLGVGGYSSAKGTYTVSMTCGDRPSASTATPIATQCDMIYDYDILGYTSLTNNGGCPNNIPCHQVNGRVYKKSGQCYQAVGGCYGCLPSASNYPDALEPVTCNPCDCNIDIYDFDILGSESLVNNGGCPNNIPCHQVVGRVYKKSGQCYKALDGCYGCLPYASHYPQSLQPITCNPCDCNIIYDYDILGSKSLVNNGGCPNNIPCHQVNGRVYKKSGQCYKALGGCEGCLYYPSNHPLGLQPIVCNPCDSRTAAANSEINNKLLLNSIISGDDDNNTFYSTDNNNKWYLGIGSVLVLVNICACLLMYCACVKPKVNRYKVGYNKVDMTDKEIVAADL